MALHPPDTVDERRTFPQQMAEELHTHKNLDIIDEYIASDFVAHIHGEDLTRAEFKEHAQQLNNGFSDLAFTTDPVIVEGDTVALQYVMTGTHTGTFNGLNPTGRTIRVTGTELIRFDEEGKMIEFWETVDQFGFLQQLGIIPEEFTAGGLIRSFVTLVKSGTGLRLPKSDR